MRINYLRHLRIKGQLYAVQTIKEEMGSVIICHVVT